jgi:hypothetical protein
MPGPHSKVCSGLPGGEVFVYLAVEIRHPAAILAA